MELKETKIPGCFLVQCNTFEDERGRFVKIFHHEAFEKLGLRTDWCEEYYSVSRKGVLRGMHFQHPPADHVKLVYCPFGEIMDVVVDLRVGSPTFGKCESFTLSAERANFIYIPSGLAHGFLSLSERSIMQYKVTSIYSPEHDAGVLWNSFGFQWPIKSPILSQRDMQHTKFEDYQSPFVYE